MGSSGKCEMLVCRARGVNAQVASEAAASTAAEATTGEAATAGETRAAGTARGGGHDAAGAGRHRVQVADEVHGIKIGTIGRATIPIGGSFKIFWKALLQFFSTPRAMANGKNFSNISGVLIMRLKRSDST